MPSPKLLFVDIETAPIIMAAWSTYEASAVWVERDFHLLSFAARWGVDGKTKVYALPDYKSYSRNKHCDKSLCKDLSGLLSDADIVIAHNGDRFDIKKINARLFINKLDPPSPYRTIDTLKESRKRFGFSSHKLDAIARARKLGHKLPNTGADLWKRCVYGDPTAWPIMRKYNGHDVDLLADLYREMRPWMAKHPDLRLYDDRPGCPACLSTNVKRRGFNIAIKRKTERLQCGDCSHWFTGQVIKAEAA